MTVRALIAAVALLAVTPAAYAKEPPSWRDFPGIENTSFAEPSGARAIQLSAEMPASADTVFSMFASSEAFASWAVAVSRIDFRTGGTMESSYDPKARFGDPENIVNRIEAYVPGRLLVIRNIQTPSNLPGRELFGKTVTILQFEPLGPDRSRVVLTNSGYGVGAEWDALYRHFEWGDAYTLDALRKRLARK